LLSLTPPIHKASRVFQLPLPLSFLLSFFWSFVEDLKLSSFHGSFLIFLFIFPLSLLLHLLFFLIWLKPSGCYSHKVQFLTFIPPKPQPHLTTSRSSLRNAVVEMGQHPYDFFSKFLCVLFSYIYILIRIISLPKALGHTKKKNERNKRGLHVYTWEFLTLLRVYVTAQKQNKRNNNNNIKTKDISRSHHMHLTCPTYPTSPHHTNFALELSHSPVALPLSFIFCFSFQQHILSPLPLIRSLSFSLSLTS
jgi:hypothetical protein